MLYCCNHCDWETDDLSAVNPEIPDLWDRLESGDLFPEGTCPECGSFVHRYDDEFLAKMAAPELLSAAQALIADWTERVVALGYESLETYWRTGPDPDPLTNRARNLATNVEARLIAAIAKATGEAVQP